MDYTFAVSCQVFSQVHDTLRVELYDLSVDPLTSINELLVGEGYAAKCDEPYESKVSMASHRNTYTKIHVGLISVRPSFLRRLYFTSMRRYMYIEWTPFCEQVSGLKIPKITQCILWIVTYTCIYAHPRTCMYMQVRCVFTYSTHTCIPGGLLFSFTGGVCSSECPGESQEDSRTHDGTHGPGRGGRGWTRP